MSQQQKAQIGQYSFKTWMTFLVPSIIGVLLFMTPMFSDGNITIAIAILAKSLQAAVGEHSLGLVTMIVVASALMSIAYALFKPRWIQANRFLHGLLSPSPVWFVVRVVGAIFALCTYFKLGGEMIYSGATGGLVLGDLMPVLFAVFIFAGLLLPLLLNFGLLELLGTLSTKIMRPLFNLPGRSAVDSLASWLGDGSVGILLTSKQYEEKFYTQREAAVIGTTFSAVSITFSLVVLSQVKLEHYFVPFYFAICLAGFVAAIIIPRLPPLSFKQDLYIDGSSANLKEEQPHKGSVLPHALNLALTRADKFNGVKQLVKEGLHNAIDMVFGVLPVVMTVGTVALILAEYTPIFTYLGMPFIPFLQLLGLPEAELASQTIVVGFADMFVPSILATGIESELTRFVIAAMSVTQLIYMSEVGALLLGSKIPVKFWELFVIFILRTLITLPVIAAVGHLIF